MNLCRSMLFTPGDRLDMIEKAARSGADAVIVDLEDAVSVDNKIARASHRIGCVMFGVGEKERESQPVETLDTVETSWKSSLETSATALPPRWADQKRSRLSSWSKE